MARIFDVVDSTPKTANFAAFASTMYFVDLASAVGPVMATLNAGTQIGQALGVQVSADADTWTVSFTGDVAADVPSLSMAGDVILFVWDGTVWKLVAYNVAPGFLDALGLSTPVGLYRLFSRTSVTDWSGNGRVLTIPGTTLLARGLRPGTFSLRRNGELASSANAAFRLQSAMSVIALLCNSVDTPNAKIVCACGNAGTGATNLQWSLAYQGPAGSPQYVSQSGAGVSATFVDGNGAPASPGWQVFGFSRSAAGVVTFYLNGEALPPSVALVLPDQGGSSNLSIGSYQTGVFPVNTPVSQVGIYATELSAAQHLRATRQLLGRGGL